MNNIYFFHTHSRLYHYLFFQFQNLLRLSENETKRTAMKTALLPLTIKTIFRPDDQHWQGVRPIYIYLLRLLYGLMVVFLGKDVWTHIFTHVGSWEPKDAMNWSVWGAFSLLALFGIRHPLKMLPMLLLEICYKVVWLLLVAYPLWRTGTLVGSPAEGMSTVFLMVVLPILFVPWQYVFKTYFSVWK